jgi:two-component system NarL family response regulator
MNTDQPVRVLIADPYLLTRECIAEVLSTQPEICVVGRAANINVAVNLFTELKPDVLVMERYLSDTDGCNVISELKATFQSAHILVLSEHCGEEQIYSAMQTGALGYFSKDVSTADLVKAILSVSAGRPTVSSDLIGEYAVRLSRPKLTRREKEITRLIVLGNSNKEIADMLFIVLGTVKSHVHRIMEKLAVSSRTQLALVAVQRGLVPMARPSLPD